MKDIRHKQAEEIRKMQEQILEMQERHRTERANMRENISLRRKKEERAAADERAAVGQPIGPASLEPVQQISSPGIQIAQGIPAPHPVPHAQLHASTPSTHSVMEPGSDIACAWPHPDTAPPVRVLPHHDGWLAGPPTHHPPHHQGQPLSIQQVPAQSLTALAPGQCYSQPTVSLPAQPTMYNPQTYDMSSGQPMSSYQTAPAPPHVAMPATSVSLATPYSQTTLPQYGQPPAHTPGQPMEYPASGQWGGSHRSF